MEVKDVVFMTKGDGEDSYVQTSILTQKIAVMTQPAIEETVRSLFSEDSEFRGKQVLSVADLGCATGPNTFLVMHTVTSAVEKIFRELNSQAPEIKFHMNDLPGNDFNTLFKGLSEFFEKNKDVSVPCFGVGVPGSIHGRLFPTNSMDLIHSSYTVHWLSQVPKFTPANKGKIYISKTSPPTVREAYRAQFGDDFTSFLKNRSREMVPDGRAIFILHGRSSPDPTTIHFDFRALGDAIALMVSQGLVEEEKLDSFNVPNYTPSKDEVQGLIESEGSFTIERLEIFEIDRKEMGSHGPKDRDSMVDAISRDIKGFTESMVSHHFGDKILDQLYGKFIKTVLIDCLSKERCVTESILVTLRKKNM